MIFDPEQGGTGHDTHNFGTVADADDGDMNNTVDAVGTHKFTLLLMLMLMMVI